MTHSPPMRLETALGSIFAAWLFSFAFDQLHFRSPVRWRTISAPVTFGCCRSPPVLGRSRVLCSVAFLRRYMRRLAQLDHHSLIGLGSPAEPASISFDLRKYVEAG
jgi:hypothetical protein